MPLTAAEREDAVRVTFVTGHGQLGGAELYLDTLLASLGERWIDRVVVLEDGPFATRLRARDLPVEVIPTAGKLGAIGSAVTLRRRLRKDRPRIIHANGVKAAIVVAMASVLNQVPMVWHKVDSTFDGPLAKLLAMRAREVITVSATARAPFGRWTSRKAHVVYNGIPDFHGSHRNGRELVEAHTGCGSSARVVALSGRLCPPKGQIELLEAGTRVQDEIPDVFFAFLGGETRGYPGYEAHLKQRASALGLANRVSFLGPLERGTAIDFLSGCDLVAVPSVREKQSGWEEGFGLVAAEAMQVGAPVVGYHHGALPEVLGDCAKLVPEGDRMRLAEAIIGVLRDRDLADALRDCGRARAAAEFSLETALTAMKDVFLRAADRMP